MPSKDALRRARAQAQAMLERPPERALEQNLAVAILAVEAGATRQDFMTTAGHLYDFAKKHEGSD